MCVCAHSLVCRMSITYSVQFVGHVIQDEFTEYHMKVSSSDGTSWLVRRRYREYRELHDHLKLKYPDRIPSVPGKKLWGNQDPNFVRERELQLQHYMDGILAVEPDCRTRVLQRFLEIKKPVSPQIGPVASSSSTAVAHAPSVAPPRVEPPSAALQHVVEQLGERIFDLSVSPSLLDASEYTIRKKKYDSIIGQALGKIPPLTTLSHFTHKDPPAEIGNAPIASENDLVAFFDSTPSHPVTNTSSSSITA